MLNLSLSDWKMILFLLSCVFWLQISFAGEQRTPFAGSVRMHLGKPTIFINNQPVPAFFYALTDAVGGRWSWEEVPQRNIELFCRSGVRLIQVDLFLDHIWFEDGRFDLEMARRQIRGVLQVCPEAAIMIRFHVNAPKWWIAAHPEENTVYADAEIVPEVEFGLRRIIEDDLKPVPRPSLASEKWLAAATEKLERFCHEFADTPEGQSVFALQLACGVYGEWHYWGFLDQNPDLSPAMTEYFRAWLKKKYGTEAKLRQAWSDARVTLASARVPGMAQRQIKTSIFRDPILEKNVMDYYECQHQVVADDILYFCRIARENWPRPLITGAFYGYFFSCFGRDLAGGHLQLPRVLQSPHIDFLCGPQAYYPESSATGDPYRSRSLITSCHLHGKLWLDEMDQRPNLNPDDDNIANIRRNVLFSLTKGMGLWFYDFGPSGEASLAGAKKGWWDHPDYLAEIEKLKKLADARLLQPYRSAADVLMVFDTDSYYHLGINQEADPVSHMLVNWTTLAAYRSGIVFDPIHLMDLAKIDLSAYQVIVFANVFKLNPQQKSFIRDHVSKNGRHLVWIYAPGFSDGQRNDDTFVSEVTHIKLKSIQLNSAPEIEMDHSIGENLRIKIGQAPFTPIFSVLDRDAQILGRWSETNEAAVARKNHKNYTSWFFALPPMDERILRHVFKQAGAHIYGDSGAIFYAGNGILAVHTKTKDNRTVTLKNGRQIRLDFSKYSGTVAIDSNNGELLTP